MIGGTSEVIIDNTNTSDNILCMKLTFTRSIDQD